MKPITIDKQTAFEMLSTAKDSLTPPSADIQIWLYCLSRGLDGEVSGASRFSLPDLPDGFRSSYLEKLSKSIKYKRKFDDVAPYDGIGSERVLYWMRSGDKIIAAAWKKLMYPSKPIEPGWLKEITDNENDVAASSFNGVGITWTSNGKKMGLLMARPPLKALSPAIHWVGKKLREIKKPIAILPLQIDAVWVDGVIYFLTEKVRNQLWSRREEKKQAQEAIGKIIRAGVLDNPEQFEDWVDDDSNVRRLLGFNEDKLKQIQSGEHWDVCGKFGLTVNRGRLAIQNKLDAAKLVKLLSDRGMLDPFTGDRMEVNGARKWE